MSFLMSLAPQPDHRLAQPYDYPPDWDANEKSFSMGVGLSSRKGGRGWYIDNNILKECEAGNYCPLNETLGYYDRMTACDDGEVCKPHHQTSPANLLTIVTRRHTIARRRFATTRCTSRTSARGSTFATAR